MSVFEVGFEFLFKYPLRLFERGTLTWLGLGAKAVVPLLVVVGAVAVASYSRTPGRIGVRDRVILAGLRVLAFVLLGFCLLRPALLVSTSVPRRNALAVVLDDSRSMQIQDAGRETRLDQAKRIFDDSAGALVQSLAQRYAVRLYRFSESTRRIAHTAELGATGSRTDLAQALEEVRRDAVGLPLGGVVLVTDGADNGGGPLADAVLSLRAEHIPVYTVGLGRERFDRDLAIDRVELPRSTLKGAVLLGAVALRARGLGGETVTVTVEDQGRIVAQRAVTIPRGTELVTVPVRIPPLEAGPRELTVSVKPVPGEVVSQDNQLSAVVRVRDRREKILYVEGTLRPEFAFIRRAAAADSNLQLVGLQRTSQGKFLRLGVDDSLELVGGFPRSRGELFQYRALVLGTVEAGFFTADQLRMIADFVGERGGGLLALGGRDSFGEGAFAGTPVAEVLPVTFGNREADSAEPARELKLALTPAGEASAALLLTEVEDANRTLWDSLPPLTSVNRWAGLKPGATALLVGRPAGGGEAEPVLATQRYGRGKTLAFQAQDSWLWQMERPLDDQSFETYWRQLLRWLLEDVPDRLEITAAPDHPGPGQRVTLRAELGDSSFFRVNDADVMARITTPLGVVDTVPLEWSLGRDGAYQGDFVPRDEGAYRIDILARRGADTLRADPQYVMVADRGLDFLNAEMRATLLRRIAEETGGRFYTAADVSRLPEDAVYTESGITVTETKDLWDMPVVFLLLVGCLGGEWLYRRKRGLA